MAWKIFLFLGVTALFATIVTSELETLKADLFETYDPVITPKANATQPVKVNFGLNLLRIVKVEEQQNAISLSTWQTMSFEDHRLKWDPAEHSGISSFSVPFEKIWLPDIVLYNGLAGSQSLDETVMAKVDSTGRVVAVSPMQLTASCGMDLTFFPYDKQECRLKFGSWSYGKSVIDLQLQNDKPDVTSLLEHPEWKLLNATLELNSVTFDDEMYQDATAVLKIERRSGPYAIKLVVPSVVTAFLILFTFILPSSSGEKIVFCLILLHSLILLSVFLHISVPSNTESVLGEFLTFALFLDFFATIIAVICYNIADALLMGDKLGGAESEKQWARKKRKLKSLRIAEYVFFILFLIIFIIGTAVILCRRG